MQFGFYFDQTRCIGCFTCCVACKDWHDTPAGRANWIRLSYLERGEYPNPFVAYFPTACYHCAEPGCLTACPVGAIRKEEATGAVIVDREVCDGCKTIPETLTAEKIKHSPCTANCPVHINVQGFVALSAQGKYGEALRLIKEENPFPSICGRVCHHPCEAACNRGEIDEPVAIKALHRYLADLDLNQGTRYVPEILEGRAEKVAIIGSGPAGLTCAYYLAREGYPVTIFEKNPMPGGMLLSGIPSYRLPKNVVEAEIQVILDMGVSIKTGEQIGRDATIAQLRDEGYKAFFLGVGAGESDRLGLEGEDAEGVHLALDFLSGVNRGERVKVGDHVVVIGGGNVAVDAARTARRLGAQQVDMACLETQEEMPAFGWEVEEAKKEGVRILHRRGPKRFLVKDGRVVGIEIREVENVFDQDGRFNPKYLEGRNSTIEADTVMVAIGQQADWTCLGSEAAGEGAQPARPAMDSMTHQTDVPDVFAGGDAITGPKTAVEAIAAGKEAAISISRYLRGVDLGEGREKDWAVVAKAQKEKYHPAKRARTVETAPEDRLNDFGEVQQDLSDDMVVEEANRCLSCGYACAQSCPYGAPQFGEEANAKMEKCDFCWDLWSDQDKPICVEACPMRALDAGPLHELRAKYGQGREAAGFAWSAKTNPSVVIRPKIRKI
ncbi:FAD-dependent oxidoreductase [Thermodesulfobacteriota bacterium]